MVTHSLIGPRFDGNLRLSCHQSSFPFPFNLLVRVTSSPMKSKQIQIVPVRSESPVSAPISRCPNMDITDVNTSWLLLPIAYCLVPHKQR